MKKICLTLILTFLSIYCFSQQKDVVGSWLGTLNVGVKLRLVIHIKVDSSGLYSATMDSPDQGAKGVPVTSTSIVGDSLHIAIASARGGFEGKFKNKKTIEGNWIQGSFKAPLTLIKTDEIATLNRPQTPKPPFNYTSEEIEYSNADNSVHFGATFTYPSSGGPFPTAILITGSGQEDRDETLFEHKPFAVIADYLTKRGFAILRVDDRGVGKTTGQVMTATSADFAKDVEAGLTYLKSRPQTDQKKLGMIGHSEGGLIAAMIASYRTDINFIVMLAGPGTTGSVLMAEQAEAMIKAQGVSTQSVKVYMQLFNKLTSSALSEKDTSVIYATLLSNYNDWKKVTPAALVKELGLNDEAIAERVLRNLTAQLSLPWTKYFIATDPAKLIEKTNAKVLALNGEKDVQVLAKQNLAGIKAALQKSKSPAYETKELPVLNHLFQTCKKCTVGEYGELEETMSPSALNVIGEWLENNVKK